MDRYDMDQAIYVTRRDRVAAGMLAALLLAVAIAAAGYGLIVLAAAAKEILVSVVAAAASLLSAVFAYAFQRTKDLELAAVQRRRELEVAERKTKQENYARILERLAPYVRNAGQAGDGFTTAYLHTWVTGSREVVAKTAKFLEDRNYQALDALLCAMRDDLRVDWSSSDYALRDITSKGLFPVPKPPSGLGQ